MCARCLSINRLRLSALILSHSDTYLSTMRADERPPRHSPYKQSCSAIFVTAIGIDLIRVHNHSNNTRRDKMICLTAV
jgi:hypothetical protein